MQDLYDAGKLAEINDYCRCDVLDTYFVFLRTRRAAGRADAGRRAEDDRRRPRVAPEQSADRARLSALPGALGRLAEPLEVRGGHASFARPRCFPTPASIIGAPTSPPAMLEGLCQSDPSMASLEQATHQDRQDPLEGIGDRLVAIRAAQCMPQQQVDFVGNEADAAIAHCRADATGMSTPCCNISTVALVQPTQGGLAPYG